MIYYRNIIIAFIVSLLTSQAVANVHTNVRIAASGILEGTYSIALKLCQNITAKDKNIICEVIPTSGTVENLELLESGEVEFAFGLANLVLDAYNGQGYFAHKRNNMLQVLRFHDQSLVIIVKDNDNIQNFADLQGMKIASGAKISDEKLIYDLLMQEYKFSNKPIEVNLDYIEYAQALCKGDIDGIIYFAEHPNALTNNIIKTCKTKFIWLKDDKISALIKKYPSLYKIILAKGTYRDIIDKATIAASTVIVTKESVDRKVVTNLLESFKQQQDNLKLSVPILQNYTKEYYITEFIIPGFKSDI